MNKKMSRLEYYKLRLRLANSRAEREHWAAMVERIEVSR